MPIGIERIWLCLGCKRNLPRTEDNLYDILNRIRTLKPCECGKGYWQATVTKTQSVHREGE